MAITNFEFPGVTLKQVFTESTYGDESTLAVACVGSMYRLHRADEASEAAIIDQSTTAYSPTAGLVNVDIPNRSTVAGETLDATASTHHLKVRNGVWAYFSGSGTLAVGTAGVNSVTFGFAIKSGNGYSAADQFGTRGVKEGDPIILTNGTSASITVATKAYTLAGETASGSFKWLNGSDALYTEVVAPAAESTAYTDEECTVSGGTITTYTAPTTATTTVSATVVTVLQSAGGMYDQVIVDKVGALTAGTITASFSLTADTDLEESSTTFKINTSTEKVTIYSDIELDLSSELGVPSVGDLQSADFYLEYRERLNSYVNVLGSTGSVSEAAELIGPAVPENPLSLAVYFALQGEAGTVVYFTAVSAETTAGYTEACDFLEKYPEVYSVVPCTNDQDIIKACAGSIESVSDDETSKVRRSLWYGIDTDSEITIYSGKTTAVAATTSPEEYAYVQFTDYNVFVYNTLQDGDIIENTATGDRYAIKKINYVNRAYIAPIDGAAAVVASTNVVYAFVRTLPTNAQLIDATIAKQCTNNLRCRCVWADAPLFEGEVIANFYLAAAAAGMRAGEECWRPLSNLSYDFFTISEPHGFSNSLLKRLGSYGVWIIANNTSNVATNLKAITTAVSNNVNTDNESIVANADEIALALCHVGENMVGNSNISSTLIELLESTIKSLLTYRCMNATSEYVGNQLLSYDITEIAQDQTNLDRVYATIECEPPKPFNRFNMTMRIV